MEYLGENGQKPNPPLPTSLQTLNWGLFDLFCSRPVPYLPSLYQMQFPTSWQSWGCSSGVCNLWLFLLSMGVPWAMMPWANHLCMMWLGVKAVSGLIASFIVNAFSACWLINLALPLIPPGTGYGGITVGRGCGVSKRVGHPASVSGTFLVLGASTWKILFDCRYNTRGVVFCLTMM